MICKYSEDEERCLKLEEEEKAKEKERKKIEDSEFPPITVSKIGPGNFIVNGTNLLFKSTEEKVIIGTSRNGKGVKDLTKEDIQKCKELRLKYITDYSYKYPR